MDFDKRLEKAIQRGERKKNEEGLAGQKQAVSEEEMRVLHSQSRIDLSEHIEECLKKVADHFLGFQYKTIVSEEGWGASIVRDDLDLNAGRKSKNQFSRFEMLIRPFSSGHIVDLNAKATVRDKEIFNRSHFQKLSELDLDSFRELIDLWVLEYVESYAAT